jgi:sRNA-binding protein
MPRDFTSMRPATRSWRLIKGNMVNASRSAKNGPLAGQKQYAERVLADQRRRVDEFQAARTSRPNGVPARPREQPSAQAPRPSAAS